MNFTKQNFTGILLIISVAVMAVDLPADFPGIYVEQTSETTSGDIFINVSSKADGVGYYMLRLQNDGTPINYKKTTGNYAYNFKVQPNGLLSYAHLLSQYPYTDGGNAIHIIMDTNMNVIDSLQLKNGYLADACDFQILPNGHFLAFGYYLTQIDLSDIVENGNPEAMVNGGIIQEFDQDKKIVWQWRSWDHIDASTYIWDNADEDTIATFLINAISLDTDGNILLSTSDRSMKISRKTNEVIWNAGGDYNDFSFANVDSTEGIDDLTGNDFHRIDNGNFLIYDNSPNSESGTSEVHEYQLNETTLTATKIQTFKPDKDIRGLYGGSAQRLSNGNTFVGWGCTSGDSIPVCSEFDPEGNEIYKLYFENDEAVSYRAYRFPYPPTFKYNGWYDAIIEDDYEFYDLETDSNMGVTIDIDYLNSLGYNQLFVNTYEYAPVYPRFDSTAPVVLPQTVVFNQDAVNEIEGEISFNANIFGISNPEEITIYKRDSIGCGIFQPLTTTYNSASGMITAEFIYTVIVDEDDDNDSINNPDEFIFTYADLTLPTDISETVVSKDIQGLLTVYPNPSEGLITLKIEEALTDVAQINIYNTTGKKVASYGNQIFSNGSGTFELNISNLSDGLYFIELQADNKIYTQTIAIQK